MGKIIINYPLFGFPISRHTYTRDSIGDDLGISAKKMKHIVRHVLATR